ncbi:MAG TPA: dTDP-4-dehydrorhamnose 3,5-epimerase [Ideonella sp.]|nr:dTDP-4-dehydrorhamnose 3,5-epimerase [Ideonella sp.]
MAVDIRPASTTYGQWFGTGQSAKNGLGMWIPPGLAHGFRVLTDSADALYKTAGYDEPQAEAALRWDDPTLAIRRPDLGTPPQVSSKDAIAPLFVPSTAA